MVNFIYALIIAVLFVSVIVTRSVYRLLNPEYRRNDVYAHLLFVQDIKDHGHRIPPEPSSVVISGSYGYPALMHWVLSFVPTRWLDSVDRFFSAILDAMLFVVILVGLLDVAPLWAVTVALVLFVATSQLMRFDISHGVAMSARKPGLLLVTIAILFGVQYVEMGAIEHLALSGGFATLVFLTSKFGLQALVAISISEALLVDPVFLGLLPIGLIAALIVSGGYYGTVLYSHLHHLKEYATKYQYVWPNQSTPFLSFLRSLPSASSLSDVLSAGFSDRGVWTVVNNPLIPLIVATYGWIYVTGTSPNLPMGFHAWIAGGFAAFVITSLPHVRFLGEAERYLEYVILPELALVATSLATFGTEYALLFGLAVVIGFVAIAGNVYGFASNSMERDHARNRIIEYLNDLEPGVVLTQPWGNGREIAYKTPHKVVGLVLNSRNAAVKAELDTLRVDHFYATDDVEWLEKTYDLDWVLFDLNRNIETGLQPADEEPAFTADSYSLYHISALRD